MKPSELIANPENWCKGTMAQDVNGKEVFATDIDAVKFCLIGALYRCYGKNYIEIVEKLYENINLSVVQWNDAPERTHKEVIDVLVAIGE